MGEAQIAQRTDAATPAPATDELVSVVVAVHNGALFLRDAIASVLEQTGVPLELIVVDDGSTDETRAIITEAARDPRVIAVSQRQGGVSAARNCGLAHARGELIAFLDADDVFLPGKLRRQSELFLADPDVVMALSSYVVTDRDLQPRRVVREVDLRRWALMDGEGPSLPSTSMVRRSALGADLRFDERFSTVADIDFALRVARLGPVKVIRQPLTYYRQHHGQMSGRRDLFIDEYPVLVTSLAERGLISPRDRDQAIANLNVRMILRPASAAAVVRVPHRIGLVLARAPSRLLLMPLHATGRRLRWWLAPGRRRLGGP